jgi:hypothetical protein
MSLTMLCLLEKIQHFSSARNAVDHGTIHAKAAVWEKVFTTLAAASPSLFLNDFRSCIVWFNFMSRSARMRTRQRIRIWNKCVAAFVFEFRIQIT